MTIYYIRKGAEGPIKIGFTASSAEKRMAQLQTGHHEKLILLGTSPGEIADEHSIHRELKDYHVHGEWFEPKLELLSIIREMVDNQRSWYYFRNLKLHALEIECASLRETVRDLQLQMEKKKGKKSLSDHVVPHEVFQREISKIRSRAQQSEKALEESRQDLLAAQTVVEQQRITIAALQERIDAAEQVSSLQPVGTGVRAALRERAHPAACSSAGEQLSLKL